MSHPARQALIAGAGIAGLSVAIALALRGWGVRVFDQTPELREVGAGLQISPNGTKLLARLGVLDRLRDVAVPHEAVELRQGTSGAVIFHLPFGAEAEARWGAPAFQIHRADLQNALVARLEELAPKALRLGERVLSYDQDGQVAYLRTSAGVEEGDVVVGADGLHSPLRAQMHGEDAPHYTGMMAWRAVVPRAALTTPPPRAVCAWTGSGRHAVTTHLRAGGLVNFVGVVERPEPEGEAWSRDGDPKDALADFAEFDPRVRGILETEPPVKRWGLYTRPPLKHWHEGRVILIGDAAHPMLPSMAQGAVQAIEDACVLAHQLDQAPVEEALTWTYAARITRTARVQKLSAANAALFHRRSRLAQAATYGPAALAGRAAPWVLRRRFDWIYSAEFP